ncbi:hypothetical protein ABH940_003386 [Streptacidiphilus sp. BW17]
MTASDSLPLQELFETNLASVSRACLKDRVSP